VNNFLYYNYSSVFFRYISTFRKKLVHSTQSTLNISIIGGSNSVIRNGYTKYLDDRISKLTNKTTCLKYYALGGVPNIYGTIQNVRHEVAANSDIIFFEYCVNDRHAVEIEQYSLDLVGKSLEGFIRKAQSANPNCIIVILIFGINLDNFYDHPCHLSELYESIAKHYSLPVINLTELLDKNYGIEFIRSLYTDKDHAHYSRPQGVKIISDTIGDHLEKMGIINVLKSDNKPQNHLFEVLTISKIYQDNFEDLAFFDNFEHGKFFSGTPHISVYQNSVFKEKNFTIYPGMSFNFLLKGRLMAIFIKSDLSDGFFAINFNSQHITTSSFSSWVNKIKPQNIISLITLPLRKFSESQDFSEVSISLSENYPYEHEFELDFNKTTPMKKLPSQWKLSIIGIAYTGKIKPLE